MGVTVGGISAPVLSWGQWVSGVQGPNERIIELPLAFEVMALHRPGRVLDAGCSCNVKMITVPVPEVTHLTQNLSSEAREEQPHRSYVAADLRDLSQWPDQYFDRVVCISTLEHVGLDNTEYDGPVETDPDSVRQAVAELWRVCGGTLLITVPFHTEPWDCPRWRCFTPLTLAQLLPWHRRGRILAAENLDIQYYARHDDGWAGPYITSQQSEAPKPVTQIVAIKLWR